MSSGAECRAAARSRRSALVATLALAVLTGRVVDRTTGQPLPHVRVAAGAARAITDVRGRFVLRGLHGSSASLTFQSDDVPAQQFTVHLGNAAEREFRLCSTTLDFNCGAPTSGGAG